VKLIVVDPNPHLRPGTKPHQRGVWRRLIANA
jgi:hypothetical protein